MLDNWKRELDLAKAMSKLLRTVRRHRDDDQVLATLSTLPVAKDTQWDLPQRAGIANEDGDIYRSMVVSSTFELVQLTARLNAKGFSVSTELRDKRAGDYDRIFVKAPVRRR